jgi:hypothetical protein
MPSLTLSDIEKIKGNFREFTAFIETGTYMGDTIFQMEPLFNQLYTVEIKPEFRDNVKSRYSGNKIEFLLGDSSEVFKTLLPTINEPAIFFLDGHWSSGYTGRGIKDCPLIEELTMINEKFVSSGVVIIDDRRLFGTSPKNGGWEDWEHINDESCMNCIKSRIKDIYCIPSELHPHDRLVIHINSISS